MIPVFKPSYGEEELEALCEPFESGWIGLGPKTREFEQKFAEFIGVPQAFDGHILRVVYAEKRTVMIIVSAYWLD
ncbi:MAG: DegT/DnrJ/EryC1/StrS family aminotransferase [candidate division WOR-3 bacterium]